MSFPVLLGQGPQGSAPVACQGCGGFRHRLTSPFVSLGGGDVSRGNIGSQGALYVQTCDMTLSLGPGCLKMFKFAAQLLGEGSPTKIDYRTKGTLILTSLLEDLA